MDLLQGYPWVSCFETKPWFSFVRWNRVGQICGLNKPFIRDLLSVFAEFWNPEMGMYSIVYMAEFQQRGTSTYAIIFSLRFHFCAIVIHF